MNELVQMLNGLDVAKLEIATWQCPGGTEENYEEI
jgi:hypothetical protein